MWGFGLEIVVMLSDRDRKTLQEEISLLDGKRLNVHPFVMGVGRRGAGY